MDEGITPAKGTFLFDACLFFMMAPEKDPYHEEVGTISLVWADELDEPHRPFRTLSVYDVSSQRSSAD